MWAASLTMTSILPHASSTASTIRPGVSSSAMSAGRTSTSPPAAVIVVGRRAQRSSRRPTPRPRCRRRRGASRSRRRSRCRRRSRSPPVSDPPSPAPVSVPGGAPAAGRQAFATSRTAVGSSVTRMSTHPVRSAPAIAATLAAPAATAMTVGIARRSSQLTAIVRSSRVPAGRSGRVEEPRVHVADGAGVAEGAPVGDRHVASAHERGAAAHLADADEGDVATAGRLERGLDAVVEEQGVADGGRLDDRGRVEVVDPAVRVPLGDLRRRARGPGCPGARRRRRPRAGRR